MTHSLKSLSKSFDDNTKDHRSIDIFTNKLNNLDNAAMLLASLLILVLIQSYHQTHIADDIL